MEYFIPIILYLVVSMAYSIGFILDLTAENFDGLHLCARVGSDLAGLGHGKDSPLKSRKLYSILQVSAEGYIYFLPILPAYILAQ